MKKCSPTLLLCVFVLLIPLVSTMMGCSRGSSTVIPDAATYDSLPAISDAGQIGVGSDRQLQGIWQMDEEWILNQVQNDNNLVGQPVPIELIGCRPQAPQMDSDLPNPVDVLVGERTADLHLNVRPFIETPYVYIKSWNPATGTLDLEVTIRNNSDFKGYDVRLIIFTDVVGHKLLNPDNNTHLWDIPEGTWSNGFKAYAKDNPNRILYSKQQRTENIQILCPGGIFSIKFAIDASWPSNCEEPYMMNNFTQGMLQAYQGATSDITVDVYDWQDNVDSVRIQCSAITGQTDTYMTKISGTKWGVELVNNNAVPEGDYFALIAATSAGSIDPLIHIMNITVSPEVGNGFALTWGGAGDDYGLGIAVDNDGNIFTVGSFSSTVDFNPDPIEEDIHTAANGYESGFLSKFDSHGDFQWVKTFVAEGGYTFAKSVDTNVNGDVYVCGSSSSYLPGAFLIKLNSSGEIIWQGKWGDGYDDEAKCVKIRNDGSVVVSGFYTGTTDFDPSSGTDIHSASDRDAFVNVFDSSCNQLWSAVWGGGSVDVVNSSDVDSAGNIYSVGWFFGTTDLNPGPGSNYHASNGGEDAFINKLDSNGNFLGGYTWGANGWDEASDCAVDEFDDVYIVGWFYYTVDFDPDLVDVEERTAVWYSDGFVSKFDSEGDFKWVFTIGEEGYDEVHSIQITGNGYFVIGGEAFDADFDPSPEISIYDGTYNAKYSSDMQFQWASTWRQITLREVSLDSSGNCYSAGQFTVTTDFDPGPEKCQIIPTGSWDAFLIKLLPNGLWE
jgi:hypothetical protein